MLDLRPETRRVANSKGRHLRRRATQAAFGVVALGFFSLGAFLWWYRSSLAEAERAVAARRFAEARQRLVSLKRWWAGHDEVELLFGDCEQAAGRTSAALAAWSRIPPESPLAQEAALRRGEAEMDSGRLAQAEAVFEAALARPGRRAVDVRHDLMQLLWQQGRLDEARVLIEQNWAEYRRVFGPDSSQAITNLRAHLSLDLEVYAIDHVQSAMDRAGAGAPEDHRVWLAQANLAVRSGRLVDARRWLDRCLAARPDDPVAWATALDLALAAHDTGLADDAARHLTTAHITPAKLASVRAYFAAARGDTELERSILENHLSLEPGDTVAIERLSQLEIRAGRSARAAELRDRKTALDRARRLYTHQVASDFTKNARELAGLAETLGRWFEARAFLSIVAKLQPSNDAAPQRLARIERAILEPPRSPSPVRLSEVIGTLPAFASTDRPAVVITEDEGSLLFTDDGPSANLTFTFDNGRSAARQLPETMSGGVALLDFDTDGWLDVYVVQGGHFPPPSDPTGTGDRLFRNRGDGTFEDVTEHSGLGALSRGYGHGAAVGDVDNDGRPDLFVTRFGAYALYRNRADGRFEDVTNRWGLNETRGWPTSAAFADLDGDGDLDLYVCHYVAWDPVHPRICGNATGGAVSYCVPHLLDPEGDHVFRNDGSRFHEVTHEAGFDDPDGRGLGVLAADLDDDGRIDVFVANDGTANFLFRNRGGLRFEEMGQVAGTAASALGGYQAGMGVACGDLDGDGRLDLVVTNFYGESSSYFHNLGNGLFGDLSSQVGLRAATRYLLGFGTALLDVDNDGYLDLATANGHVNDVRPIFPYAMPAQLLLGGPSGRLIDVSQRSGPAWQVPRLGRGLAAGDLDNDGRVDLVILAQDGPLALFHNSSKSAGRARHFVTLGLEGTSSNRDAVGARVVVRAGGRRQTRQRTGGGSYQSASDPRLHFGLGATTKIEEIEVTWPSGRVDRYHDLAADTGYLIREGRPGAAPLKGFRAPQSR
jgi:tetratricopeptide (TPR) repeat protein